MSDTIAAIATPPGVGGIGIIRISGSESFKIAASLFSGKTCFKDIKSHSVRHGYIVDPETGEMVDEVLITKMNAPRTFTREDVVEINCHGGTAVLKRILGLVIKYGARIAEPGEFTKRAFLNGRIDLSQAEAVIDIINAQTEQSSKAAVDQLQGRLSKQLGEIRRKLIELIAHIEVTVDYPEEDIEEITGEQVYKDLLGIEEFLEKALKSFERGRIIREGLNVVILGKPNVGKSSLLNVLSGRNKAIVTDIPGTTRDIIEEHITLDGIPIRLVDTAGIRETDDLVERLGVDRARDELSRADLVIFVLDAYTGLQSQDRELLRNLDKTKSIVMINKIDLTDDEKIKDLVKGLEGFEVIPASVKKEEGVEQLQDIMKNLYMKGSLVVNNEILITNVRHKDQLEKALQSLREAKKAYEAGMPLDCITIDIKNAADHIGNITGESIGEQVMHEIFSRFCLGK